MMAALWVFKIGTSIYQLAIMHYAYYIRMSMYILYNIILNWAKD